MNIVVYRIVVHCTYLSRRRWGVINQSINRNSATRHNASTKPHQLIATSTHHSEQLYERLQEHGSMMTNIFTLRSYHHPPSLSPSLKKGRSQRIICFALLHSLCFTLPFASLPSPILPYPVRNITPSTPQNCRPAEQSEPPVSRSRAQQQQ